MKTAVISLFCSLVSLACADEGFVPGQMSVTPPAGGEVVEVDAPGCYDRSDAPVGGVWNRLCKPFRQQCLPAEAAGIKNWVYFKSPYTDILTVNQPNLVIDSLTKLDAEYEKSLLVRHLESISKKGTDRAKKCLEYGSYFLCSTFYPMCASDDYTIWPCRETCELTQSLCDKELAEEGYPGLFPAVFDCSLFPTGSCSPSATLANCALNYNITKKPTPPPTVVTSKPTTVAAHNDTEDNTTTATQPVISTEPPVVITPSTSTQCPSDNGMQLEKCDCKKKIRDNFSKGILTRAKYDFFAYVKIINRYITTLDERCHYAYNVSIISNYHPADCSSTDYGCTDSIATVYTADRGDEDCCITPYFNSGGMDEFFIGGYLKEKKWFLDGEEKGCTIAPATDTIKAKIPKIDGWISSASRRRR